MGQSPADERPADPPAEQRPQITITINMTPPDPDPLFIARLRDALRRRPPAAGAMRVRLY